MELGFKEEKLDVVRKRFIKLKHLENFKKDYMEKKDFLYDVDRLISYDEGFGEGREILIELDYAREIVKENFKFKNIFLASNITEIKYFNNIFSDEVYYNTDLNLVNELGIKEVLEENLKDLSMLKLSNFILIDDVKYYEEEEILTDIFRNVGVDEFYELEQELNDIKHLKNLSGNLEYEFKDLLSEEKIEPKTENVKFVNLEEFDLLIRKEFDVKLKFYDEILSHTKYEPKMERLLNLDYANSRLNELIAKKDGLSLNKVFDTKLVEELSKKHNLEIKEEVMMDSDLVYEVGKELDMPNYEALDILEELRYNGQSKRYNLFDKEKVLVKEFINELREKGYLGDLSDLETIRNSLDLDIEIFFDELDLDYGLEK